MDIARQSEHPGFTPNECKLSELHGGTPYDSDKNLILVVEGEESQQVSMKALLGIGFPNYTIKRIKNAPEEISAVTNALRENIAMIVDTSSNENRENAFVHGGENDFGMVPIVAQPSVPSDMQENARIALLVAEGKVDGGLEYPTRVDKFVPTLDDAIEKRLTVKRQLDEVSRPIVIAEYIEFVDAAIAEWGSKLSEMSSIHKATQVDIDDLEDLLPRMRALADDLATKGTDIDVEDLSQITHDMNNILAFLIPVSDMASKEEGVESHVVDALQSFLSSLRVFAKYTKLVQSANRCRGFTSWMYIDPSKIEGTFEPQNLEIPEGFSVCVVDDCSEVLQYCSRAISKAGGKYFEAGNHDALQAIGKIFGSEGIDLFLLDNNLGEGPDGKPVRGIDLVPSIRSLFPNALIIAHTGDAEGLKADPENPYSQEGIEIVGKHRWNEVTRILGEKGFLTE